MAISHESDQREDESEDSEMRLAEIRVDWRFVFFPSTLKAKQETQSRKSTDEHKLTTQLIDIATNILLR